MHSVKNQLIQAALCVITGAVFTFFIFGIIQSKDSELLPMILDGFLWIVFGFVKRGIVNTTENGQLIFHNLWIYILVTSAIFLALNYWRIKSN
jgi:hypothetical protein